MCPICEKDIEGAHVSQDCNQAVHLFLCGDPVPDSDEGYDQPVICFKCKEKQKDVTGSSAPVGHGELITYKLIIFQVYSHAFSNF